MAHPDPQRTRNTHFVQTFPNGTEPHQLVEEFILDTNFSCMKTSFSNPYRITQDKKGYQMIKIGKLEIIDRPNNMVRLQASVDIDEIKDIAFMDCDKKYLDYIVKEVSDAFVWMAIRYAMVHHHDIYCETPVSSSFLHNIQYYCRSLMTGDSKVTNPSIIADTIEFHTSGKAVCCPISCGVDSLYSVKKYISNSLQDFKLTHLFLTTQGLFGQYNNPRESRNAVFERGENLSEKLQLDFIGTFTNPAVFPQNFALAHTHSTLFSILSLRKLFSIFLYPSGYDITEFTIKGNSKLDVAFFDLLMSSSLTLPGFRIYSSGGEVTRLEKVKYISDYDIAHKNLSVCIRNGGKNCNICLKCKRTILELDAIGRLDKFSDVFDIEYYKNNRHFYFRYIIENSEDEYMKPLFTHYSIKEPEAIEHARKLSRFPRKKTKPS